MGIPQKKKPQLVLPSRLRLIKGEGDPSRFEEADKKVPELGYQFFRVGRLSLTGEIQLGAIRQVLSQVKFKPEETAIYEPWLELTAHNAAKRGKDHITPSAERLRALTENDDPLMHIIETFEIDRTKNYPDIEREGANLQTVLGAYALAQASIHGRPRRT